MNTDKDKEEYLYSNHYSDKDFSEALRELMDYKKWSYNLLSYRCGLSGQYLNQLVNRKSIPPKDENIIKIATAFDLKPEYFKEYRNRRLFEKMLQSDETDIDTIKNYNIRLSPNEVKKLEVIISELKEKYDK